MCDKKLKVSLFSKKNNFVKYCNKTKRQRSKG